jgi:long-chain fatty acid transport protein
MKKQLLAVAVAAALLAPQAVGAEGFAIYEWSAEGVAMGGARMFAENDAANMAYDPASITKIEGEALKVSATYLSPHGKYDLNKNARIGGGTESGHNRVHPAWAPGTYYVKQLNEKEWIGMGAYSRFGMASQFERASIAGTNAFSSKLNGLSVGVNYARKLDSKWAASVGAEVNYIGLQLDKNQYLPKKGLSPLHIEGESYALGWNAAANYAFDKKNEMGLVYRSKITHSMEADYDVHNAAIPLALSNGDAYGVVTLPESLSLGYNHKFDDKNRVELNAIWTRWERYDALDISFTGGALNGQTSPNAKNWSNSKRLAVGYEHKFSDKYSGMLGYAFDKSAIPYDGGDFMIPTGNRTTYSLGTQYHDKKQTLAVALAWMNVGSLDFAGGGFINGAHTRDSYTKIASISYQRNF